MSLDPHVMPTHDTSWRTTARRELADGSTPVKHAAPARGGLRLPALMAVVLLAGMLAHPRTAAADGRAFTYVYETTTMAPGQVEYEQWVTWKTHKRNDASFDRIDFRHEIEFGLTDVWQMAIYVSDWRYEDGDSVANDRARWKNVSFESIYQLTHPGVDPFGSALYGEVKVGDEKFVLEGKLLLQKNFGPWIVAWNGILEAEWEDQGFVDTKAVLAQTFGVSYQLHPSFAVGGELVHEVEYSQWKDWQQPTVYIGPNATYRGDGWWVGVTPLFQATDVNSEADYQVRLLFGIDF